GAIGACFFKFANLRSSYFPPNPACSLSLCGLSLLPSLPVAVVLAFSVWHELLAAELALFKWPACRLLLLDVERNAVLVRAKGMVAVERLEALRANRTSR